MSLSRGLSLIKKVNTICKPVALNAQQVRHGGGGQFSYRCGAYPPTKFQSIGAETMMGVMWWWILYHVVTQPDHLLGEFFDPDPSLWTDEELGIPPDDVD